MKMKILAALSLALFAFAATAAPTCSVGTAGVAPLATLTFVAPTTNTDGSPIATPLTYSIYQGSASGAEVKVSSGVAGSPVVINTNLKDGATFYFYIVVVDANGTPSAPSNEGCKSFPNGVPGTITITLT